MYDIIFCSVPYSDLDHVYSAPAILKGVANHHGYTAKTVDFGGLLFKQCNYDSKAFYKIQNYFITPQIVLSNSEKDILDKFFNEVIEYLKKNSAKYIGISAFSYWSHKCILLLCKMIRDARITSKIIIGGAGALSIVSSFLYKEFNIRINEKLMTFGEVLRSRKLADDVIYGDGEDAILKILQGDYVATTQLQSSDTFRYPIPDYTDYNFKNYIFNNNDVIIPITGSKGCVRDCDFCDVKYQAGNYRYRSGKDVAAEMISVAEQYGFRIFRFTDNLVNGGFKPFGEFLEIIAEYNLSNPDKRISWNGQYICRPPKEIPKNIYSLMRDAGAHGLTIGAESGSNHVLEQMNKKSTVEALYTELEQLRAHNITCTLLTMSGHWAEEYEHFVEHCMMLVKLVPYIRSGTISAVSLGQTLLMIDGTPAIQKSDVILSDFDKLWIWHCRANPENTFKERTYRRMIIGELCKRLRIPTILDANTYQNFSTIIETEMEDIISFYKNLNVPINSRAEHAYLEFDNFYNNLLQKVETDFTIELDLIVSESKGQPEFILKIDEQVLFSDKLSTGAHKITRSIKTDNLSQIVLSLAMKGKSKYDTVVDASGNIVADKFIQIDGFKINGFDIAQAYDIQQKAFVYTEEDGSVSNVKFGFWSNASLTANILLPFITWYNNLSNQNVIVADTLTVAGRNFSHEEQILINSLQKLSW